MSGRPWTDQEIAYLERHWYTSSLAAMTAYLGRTKVAVRNKGRLMGLGRQIDGGGETMSVKMINNAFGKQTVSHITAARMEATGLKVRRLRFGRVNRYCVRIDEFWEWLRLNQGYYPVTKLEPLALGPEPAWVEEARHAARAFPVLNSQKLWTQHDDMLLVSMSREKRPISEICAALKRTENAVRCHAAGDWRIDLSYAADHRRRPWTEAEKRRLTEMALAGRCSMDIAVRLDRTERMVRIKLKEICGTSSISRLQMTAAGEEAGKRGRRKGAKRGDSGADRSGKREAG